MKNCTCAGILHTALRGPHHMAGCPWRQRRALGWSQDLRATAEHWPTFILHVNQAGVDHGRLCLVPQTADGYVFGYKATVDLYYARFYPQGPHAARQRRVVTEVTDWLTTAAEKVLLAAGWRKEEGIFAYPLWHPPTVSLATTQENISHAENSTQP